MSPHIVKIEELLFYCPAAFARRNGGERLSSAGAFVSIKELFGVPTGVKWRKMGC
jgi:hypothetical protein